MIMYINGQDIRSITFAVLDSGQNISEKDIFQKEVGPEGFLKAFRDFLSEKAVRLDEIKRVFVVVGPGSATALRSILAIVNTMAFTLPIELIGIEKQKDEHDIDTVKKILEQDPSTFEIKKVLSPIYEHEPRITVSTKDVLRRKI